MVPKNATEIFLFKHLADAFIQSDLHGIKVYVNAFMSQDNTDNT